MITIDCTCGQQYRIESKDRAERFSCPRCGLSAAAAMTPTAPSSTPPFRVACGIHPDQPATHNCLNCAKPLCMECVRANGYFCSPECKAAVAASEPDAGSAAHADLSAQTEQRLEQVSRVGKVVLWGVGAVIAASVLWWLGRWWLAPNGQVTATLPVHSEVARFRFLTAGQDTVLVQANDELMLVRLPDLQKTWSAPLREWEERISPPPEAEVPRAREYRDPLELTDVRADTVLLQSGRQLVALDRTTGTVRWKTFETQTYRQVLNVHDAGILTVQHNPPTLVNLALTDGRASMTIASRPFSQMACAHDRVFLWTIVPKKGKDTGEDPEELTAGAIHGFDVKSILAHARDTAQPKPKRDYRLEVLSLTDGAPLGETVVSLDDAPVFEKVGDALFVLAGNTIHLYRDRHEPVWTATLPAPPTKLAAGGNLLLAATESGLIALDAQTGQPKWTRPDLPVTTVVVGPDRSVYATITFTKDQAQNTEVANYRTAAVETGLTGPPSDRRALVKLDHVTGKTRWGVRNIGEQVLFDDDKLFVADRIHGLNLLTSELIVGSYSLRQLAPRNGTDVWKYLKKGNLYHAMVARGKIAAVVATDPPAGRVDPTCAYELVIVEGK